MGIIPPHVPTSRVLREIGKYFEKYFAIGLLFSWLFACMSYVLINSVLLSEKISFNYLIILFYFIFLLIWRECLVVSRACKVNSHHVFSPFASVCWLSLCSVLWVLSYPAFWLRNTMWFNYMCIENVPAFVKNGFWILLKRSPQFLLTLLPLNNREMVTWHGHKILTCFRIFDTL